MTYTFKLARRLAVSRHQAVVAAVAFLVACDGETTAPTPGVSDDVMPAVEVVPARVTVETDQPVRFRVEDVGGLGRVSSLTMNWEASGGAIDAEGNFISDNPGTYRIIGRRRGRGQIPADTSIVIVLPRPIGVVGVTLSPDSLTLISSATHTFVANGIRYDGSTTPIGVSWTATGGTIDAAGHYTAGEAAGTFNVIATRGPQADTAAVSVTLPDVEPPLPTPDSTPQLPPTLNQVILVPGSTVLEAGANLKFLVYGRTATGDSVAASPVFTATGGTVNERGRYQAGEKTGTYRLIASVGALADTAVITVTPPTLASPTPTPAPPPVAGPGIPFGSFHLPSDMFGVNGQNGALVVLRPETAAEELAVAKAKGAQLVVALVRNRPFYTNADKTFNMTKWKAEMDQWRGRTAVLEEYYRNGTIILNYVVDEPNCQPCWGGQAISHSDLQEMTRYSKVVVPFLPTVIRAHPAWLRLSPSWPYLDAAWAQTAGPLHGHSARMTPEEFRDKNVADAKAMKVALVMGLNTINGGDGSSRINGTWALDPDLSDEPSAKYRYQMSAAEFERAGKAFAAEPYVCALINWRYSVTLNAPEYATQFDLRSDVQAATAKVAAVASGRAARSCVKPT